MAVGTLGGAIFAILEKEDWLYYCAIIIVSIVLFFVGGFWTKNKEKALEELNSKKDRA